MKTGVARLSLDEHLSMRHQGALRDSPVCSHHVWCGLKSVNKGPPDACRVTLTFSLRLTVVRQSSSESVCR
jgi:hypothetical protein